MRCLSGSPFDRLQISLQSPDRNFDAADVGPWLEAAAENQLAIVGSISTLLDTTKDFGQGCIIQGGFGSKTLAVSSRRCPIHGGVDHLSDVIGNACTLLQGIADKWLIHFPYYRYENVHQCVAAQCLERFGNETGHRPLRPDLDNDAYCDWVSWRQQAMSEALQQLTRSVRSGTGQQMPTSVEIDFEEAKGYLAGPAIQEGLTIRDVGQHVDEIYVHVESSQLDSRSSSSSTRDSYADFYVSHLRLATGMARDVRASPHLFFWNLEDADSIESKVRDHLDLAKGVGAEGVVLYSGQVQHVVAAVTRWVSSH